MENLTVKDLRKLVKLYNLEVHIKGSSKMKKDELKSSLLKHLEINEDGELKHKILTNTYKIEKGELKPVERKKKEEEQRKIKEEEDKKRKEEEQRKKEEEMMMKEDVNVKAKPKEITVLELIKMYEDNIEKMKKLYKKVEKSKNQDDLKEFDDLLKNKDLDVIYRKLMGVGGKFTKTSDKGRLIEIQRKNRDMRDKKYNESIKYLKEAINFNYDNIDTILNKTKNNDDLLNILIKFFPSNYGNNESEKYTKQEMKDLIKITEDTLKTKDYENIKKYLDKQYPYGKRGLDDTERAIFLLRFYYHYESGRTLMEKLTKCSDYINKMRNKERKKMEDENREGR